MVFSAENQSELIIKNKLKNLYFFISIIHHTYRT